MKASIKIFLIILFSTFIFTSCYDKVELEDRGFVMAIGVDKYDASEKEEKDIYEEEIKKKYNYENNIDENYLNKNTKNQDKKNKEKVKEDKTNKTNEEENKSEEKENISISLSKDDKNSRFYVTISKANAQALGNNQPEGNAQHVKTAHAETVSEAKNIIDMYSSQKLYYGYTELIVIGEEVLKDEELLRETIDTLERNNEISREVYVIATKGKAKDVIETDTHKEPLIGIFVSKFYRNNDNMGNSKVLHKNLESLANSLYTTSNALIPTIKKLDNNLKMSGAAVIKDFELVGFLDDVDLRGYLWMIGKGKGIEINTKFEDVYVPMQVDKNSTTLTFREEEDVLIANMNINIDGNIKGYNLTNDGIFEDEILEILSTKYEYEILKDIRNTFVLFQSKFEVDSLEFREKLEKYDNDLFQKYGEDNWEESFRNMILELDINVSIVSVGSIK